MKGSRFISHNKNVCNDCAQFRNGKCNPEPGYWCKLLHAYNQQRPLRPVIHEAKMVEEVQLR